jgi:hypothetical protein
MIDEAAARKRAKERGDDPDDTAETAGRGRAATAEYLGRRIDGSGGGYDPLRGSVNRQ